MGWVAATREQVLITVSRLSVQVCLEFPLLDTDLNIEERNTTGGLTVAVCLLARGCGVLHSELDPWVDFIYFIQKLMKFLMTMWKEPIITR